MTDVHTHTHTQPTLNDKVLIINVVSFSGVFCSDELDEKANIFILQS